MSLSAPNSPLRSSPRRHLGDRRRVTAPGNPSKKKISKDEKICQLKSDLKVAREENVRLRRDIERLKVLNAHNITNHAAASASGAGQKPHRASTQTEEQRMKFREAMRALKKVTVSQEVVIKNLRNKNTQRKKEIKEKDNRIAELEQKLMSLETSDKVIKRSSGDQELRAKIKELQMAYDETVCRKNDLEELLDQKEAQMEAVEKQRNSLLTPLHKRNASSCDNSDGERSVGSGSLSLQSVSTVQDFDIARLKTELAKKSDRIVKLEMDLEMVRDELDELRQKQKQKRHSGASDGFGGGGHAFFPPNFMAGNTQQNTAAADDWTDADETDCESEFGESFFNKKDDENVDFW